MIDLGMTVKDTVSGFSGVVLARMECSFEATQCRVHPKSLDNNGAIIAPAWIEESRLEIVDMAAPHTVGFVSIAGGGGKSGKVYQDVLAEYLCFKHAAVEK